MTNKRFPCASLLFVLLVVWLTACRSNEVADSSTVDQNSIFQEYSVSFSERTGYTTVKAAFRHGGSNGTTLVLVDPSQVRFNGLPLAVDSNFLSGAFYYLPDAKSLQAGAKLQFAFTDGNGKLYTNEETLTKLETGPLPTGVQRDADLEIPLTGKLPGVNDKVKVYLVNKAYSSMMTYAPTGHKLIIPANNLKPFSGKITVELTLERTVALKNASGEGGTYSVSYEHLPFEVEIQ